MMVGWSSFAVKGLWVLRDNIYEFVCVFQQLPWYRGHLLFWDFWLYGTIIL
jgi:hypothetical protein